MSKLFGMVLLLGLSAVVLLSIGLLIYEWINSSNDTIKPTLTPHPSSVVLYQPNLQALQNYGLVDARLY